MSASSAKAIKTGHLDKPFRFEDLPPGLLGAKVFPFLLNFYRHSDEIQAITKTNKLWARAAIDWIKSQNFPINSNVLEKINDRIRDYTCLRPVSRAAFIRIYTGKEVAYYLSRGLTEEQIQADLQKFDELGISIKTLGIHIRAPLTDATFQVLLSRAPRALTVNDSTVLPDDSLRHLKPHSLKRLSIFGRNSNLPESQLIKAIESQGRLQKFTVYSNDTPITDATLEALEKTCSKSLTKLRLMDTFCIQTTTREGWISLFAQCKQLKIIWIRNSPAFTADVIQNLPQSVETAYLDYIPEPAPETWGPLAKARAGKPLDIHINGRDITDEINRLIQGEQA